MTGWRQPHVSGVLTTGLEQSLTLTATSASLRSSSRIVLQSAESSSHADLPMRESRRRPIVSHARTAKQPSAQASGIAVTARSAHDPAAAKAGDCLFAFGIVVIVV